MATIAFIITAALAIAAGVAMRALTAQLAGEAQTSGARHVARPAARIDLKGGIDRLGQSRLASLPVDRAFLRRSEAQLARAGMDLSPSSYWALCIVGALSGLALGLICALALPALDGIWRIALAAALAVLGAFAPRIYVASRTRRRKELVRASLSYTLDLLSVVVSSGQTIEQAIKTVAEKSEGPLADEFSIASKQISVLGDAPAAALRDMAARVDVAELSLFCTSVEQALAAGSPLADELKIQAEEAADKYYQTIDEKAGKISNKMVFPLALMMLPAIMIVALVPMVLRLAEQMPGFLPGLA